MTDLLSNGLPTNGACRPGRLWGAIVKSDIISDSTVVLSRPAAARRGHQFVSCAAAGLVAMLLTGCHCLYPQRTAESHYGRLEQACFGYEPTVWRALPGDCEQAVRMIPDAAVRAPAAAPSPPPAAVEPEGNEAAPSQPQAAPDADGATPDQRNRVPGVIRGLLEEGMPPAREPARPDDRPPAAPAEPAAEPPAGSPALLPSVEPALPPAAPAPSEPADKHLRQSRTRPVRPVSAQVSDHEGSTATDAAAQELFRSVEKVLAAAPVENAVARPPQAAARSVTPSAEPGTVGLAKFIY